MAKATAITTVTRIQLDLGHEEAQTLIDVLSQVGGDIHRSRRRVTDNIRKALLEAGGASVDEGTLVKDLADGGLWFEANTKRR